MSNRFGKPDHLPSKSECTSRSATARLVDVKAAASYLAVSVSTLYGWVWQRRVPFVKCGRALRFDLADLDNFIAANKTSTRRNLLCQSETRSLVK
jgi:excisionase family DNA binding protein